MNRDWRAIPHDRSFAYAAFSFIVLVLASGLAVAAPGSLSLILCLLFILVGIYPLIRGVLSRRLDLFEPIVMVGLCFVLLIGIRGVFVIQNGSVWLTSYDPDSVHFHRVFCLVFAYSILGLVALYLGYYSGLGRRMAASVPRMQLSWDPGRVRLCMVLCLGISVAGLVLYQTFLSNYRGLGLASDRFRNPAQIVSNEIEMGGTVAFLFLSKFAAVGLLLSYAFARVTKRRRAVGAFALLFSGVLILYFLNFGGGKATLLFSVFQLVVCHHYLGKRYSVRRLLPIALIVILVIMPFIGYYRGFGLDLRMLWGNLLSGFSEPGILLHPLLGRSLGADMFFLIIDRTPEPHPFQFGGSYLKLLTMFVPRAIWSGKPWSFGVEFNRTYLEGTGGASSVAPLLIGEAYVNFWLVGVVLVAFTFGVVLRFLYSYCMAHRGECGYIILYSLGLTGGMMAVEGPLSDHVFFLLVLLIPFFLATLPMRLRFVLPRGKGRLAPMGGGSGLRSAEIAFPERRDC